MFHVDSGRDPQPPPRGILEEARSLVFGRHHCLRLESSLDLLDEHLQRELRQQSSRREALLKRSESLGDSGRELARDRCNAVQRRFDEGMARINQRLGENLRDQTLPASAAMTKVEGFVEELSRSDIATETAGGVDRLSLSPDFVEKVVGQLKSLGRDAFEADSSLIRGELEALARMASSELASILKVDVSVPLPEFDETGLWEKYQKPIQFDSQWHRDLPRTSSRSYLSQGLKWVSVIVSGGGIVLSVLAFYGVDVKALVRQHGWIVPFVFFAGLVWAAVEDRKTRREKLEQEAINLRGQLETEIKKFLQDKVMPYWQSSASQYLRDAQKSVGLAIEQQVGPTLTRQAKSDASERAEVQAKLKFAESRVQDLTGFRQQVVQLRKAAQEARQVFEQAAREALPLSKPAPG